MTTTPNDLTTALAELADELIELLEAGAEYADAESERERIWEGRRDYRWQEPLKDGERMRALAARLRAGRASEEETLDDDAGTIRGVVGYVPEREAWRRCPGAGFRCGGDLCEHRKFHAPDHCPTPPPAGARDEDVEAVREAKIAIEQWLAWGEQAYKCGHQGGYYSGGGWGAQALKRAGATLDRLVARLGRQPEPRDSDGVPSSVGADGVSPAVTTNGDLHDIRHYLQTSACIVTNEVGHGRRDKAIGALDRIAARLAQAAQERDAEVTEWKARYYGMKEKWQQYRGYLKEHEARLARYDALARRAGELTGYNAMISEAWDRNCVLVVRDLAAEAPEGA